MATQLALLMANIARIDFPSRWPGLLSTLCTALSLSSTGTSVPAKMRSALALKCAPPVGESKTRRLSLVHSKCRRTQPHSLASCRLCGGWYTPPRIAHACRHILHGLRTKVVVPSSVEGSTRTDTLLAANQELQTVAQAAMHIFGSLAQEWQARHWPGHDAWT